MGSGPPADNPPALEKITARRRFLRWLSGIGAALSAGLIGYPAGRAFFWPSRAQPAPEKWIKVADDIALVDIGTPVRLDFVELTNDAWVESRVLNNVWVYTEDGAKFKAYSGHCTHLGCGFFYDKDRKSFSCPCHHGAFDVKTGAVLDGPPPRPLDELQVEIRDDAVFVRFQEFRLGIADRVEV